MIAFLCGLFVGLNIGAWGLIMFAIVYNKHHPDD